MEMKVDRYYVKNCYFTETPVATITVQHLFLDSAIWVAMLVPVTTFVHIENFKDLKQ